jgi:hypothetical protein
MEENSLLDRYKIIPLNSKEIEDYEKSCDNIGELLVFVGRNNISKQCKVVFNLSKEALIGFTNNAIRLADLFPENHHMHIDPLGTLLSNQSMGFFLTPQSAELIIGCKSYGDLSYYGIDRMSSITKRKENYNELKFDYLVDMNFDNDFIESYSIGFNNVAEMKILKDGEDFSNRCTVKFMLSKNALLGLGTQLIRLAHNFDKSNNYFVKPISNEEVDCSLGFFLTPNSANLAIRCENFNNVFYYDRDFGRM